MNPLPISPYRSSKLATREASEPHLKLLEFYPSFFNAVVKSLAIPFSGLQVVLGDAIPVFGLSLHQREHLGKVFGAAVFEEKDVLGFKLRLVLRVVQEIGELRHAEDEAVQNDVAVAEILLQLLDFFVELEFGTA